MSRRARLKYATLGLCLAGVALAAYPFVAALRPNAKAESALTRIDIRSMQPNSVLFAPLPDLAPPRDGSEWTLMLIMDDDRTVNAWQLQRRHGATLMPDYRWWMSAFYCKDFGPTLRQGRIDAGRPIQCHDTDPELAGWLDKTRWGLDGKSLHPDMPDLPRIRGHADSGFFILGKPGPTHSTLQRGAQPQ